MPLGASRLTGLAKYQAAAGGDPYWADVGLLMSARNNAIEDLSDNSLTLTKIGTAASVAASSTTSAFGDYSVKFTATTSGNGTGALSVGPDSVIDISTGDFTMEWWQYSTINGATNNPFGFGSFSIQGYVNYVDSTTKFAYEMDNNSSMPLAYASAYYAAAKNTWNHMVIQRDGDVFSLYINGTRVDQTTQAITINNVSGRKLAIGDNDANGSFTTSQCWNGYLDEFRITKGVARYSGASFTALTERFPVGE